MVEIKNDWKDFVFKQSQKDYFKELEAFLNHEYSCFECYPSKENWFNALNLVSKKDVKVVIIGQDPYHQPNQAHGLAFSVCDGVKLPPSLKNIFKEIENEFGFKPNPSGNLERWARQGVLLLNTSLSVRKDVPNSHSGKGWEIFTKSVVEEIANKNEPVVFLLWGSHAFKFENLIFNPNHKILKSAHPSPLSAHRGFFGNNHFVLANQFLKQNGLDEIDWQ